MAWPCRLELHAPVELLQQCLHDLRLHVPWDTPSSAPQAPTGPQLMSTVPSNGSEAVSTSNFQASKGCQGYVQAMAGAVDLQRLGASG